MAVDLGNNNSTRWYSVPDHGDFTLPAGDWTWFIIHRPDYTNAGGSTNHLYALSNGAIADVSSYHHWVQATVRQSSGAVNNIVTAASGVVVPNQTWVITWLKRQSSNIRTGFQNIESTASKGEYTDSATLFGPYNPANSLNIGRRGDANTDRYYKGYIMYVGFAGTTAISTADFTSLAEGTALDTFSWYSDLLFDLHMDTAAATLTDAAGSHVATRNGTGWATVSDPSQINLTTPSAGVVPVFYNNYVNQGIL